MEKKIEEYLKLADLSVERDPWVLDRGLSGFCKEIIDEVNETYDEIKNEDFENLKEEMGDVLSDVIHMILIAQDKGLFKFEDVITSMSEKLKRRKPYILELNDPELSKEETQKIWDDVKKEEKNEKTR